MSDFSLAKRFDWIWRFLLAHTVTATMFLLGLVSYSMPFAGQIKPYFLLMPVYFWSIYRPAVMPPVLILIIGVLFDLVSGQPYIGLSAFILLLVQWIIKDQRLFLMAQPFIVIWLGFSLTCLAAAVLEWAIFSLLSFKIVHVLPAFAEAGISILVFPALAWVMSMLNRFLPAGVKTFM